MNQRIGIYSGSFDPIHQGHLSFANEVQKSCRLDSVIFLPERAPRGKPNVTSFDQRVGLLQQAVADSPHLSVVELDMPQFTVAGTLPMLQVMFPDANFTLLIGSDVVRTFEHRWDNLGQLLTSVGLAIGMRQGDHESDIENILANLEKTLKISIRYTLIYTDHSHVTSTHIRNGSHTA